jgi:hypothetical protein
VGLTVTAQYYLVTHPHRLITKDELLDAVWPGVVVTNVVLRVTVGALRKALGDTAQTARFIATVPWQGYRFLAPAEEYPDAASGTVAPALPAAPHPPHSGSGIRYSDDNCLHVVFLLHDMFESDKALLHCQLLLSRHGQIRPEMNVLSFHRLTGHETYLREGFLNG